MKQITLNDLEIQFGAANLLKKLYLSDFNKSALQSYQREALRDLERFVSHIPATLEFLLDRRFILWDKVMERDSYKCKPRITLYPHITQKGNLALSWKPTGNVIRFKEINETDFDESVSSSYNQIGNYSRPACELLFIHNFQYLMHSLKGDPQNSQVSALLIGASCAAMESFRNFLMISFEVTTEYWFELTFNQETISKFDIVNVAENEARKEKEWFNGFQIQYGMKPKEFINIYKKNITPGKASKALKVISINMDWRDVKRIAERLKGLHSDALSDEMNVLTP